MKSNVVWVFVAWLITLGVAYSFGADVALRNQECRSKKTPEKSVLIRYTFKHADKEVLQFVTTELGTVLINTNLPMKVDTLNNKKH